MYLAILAIVLVFSPLGLSAQALVIPRHVQPGDPLAAWFVSPQPLESGIAQIRTGSGLVLSSASAFFMPSEGETSYLYGFLLAVPQAAAPGTLEVVLKGSYAGAAAETRHFELSESLEADAKVFAREDIPLDAFNTAIRTASDPAKTAESVVFAKVFALRDATALFAGGTLIKPLEGSWRETAGFGDIRRYIYSSGGSDTTRHGGVDIGTKEGTPVLACAAGRVVFAARRIVTGITIVIEHLPGFFSVYMHLSASEVNEGLVVSQGQRIGKVGSTGLSTGPHLHWELRIGEVSVNPYRYLELPILDKTAVSSRIKPPMEGR